MTFQTAKLLRKLKKAQVCEDWCVQINFDTMTVATHNQGPYNTVVVDLSEFKTSIHSLLSELKKADYIHLGDFGYVSVTHTGWHAFGATVADAVKFTVRDVIVPVFVAVIAAVITTWVLD